MIKPMKHLILTSLASLTLLTIHAAEPPATDAAGRWSAEKANQWYAAQPWPCGFNYVPAHAISYTEMWMPYNFDAAKMDKELALAEDDRLQLPARRPALRRLGARSGGLQEAARRIPRRSATAAASG